MNKLIVTWVLIVLGWNAMAAAPTWSVVPNDYQYSMTITAVLNIDGIMADQATDMVGAFVDGVCRGVGNPSSFTTADGTKIVFLQVYSNTISGETVTFKLYDTSKDVLMDAINQVSFVNDGSLGNTSDPYIITTNKNPTDISLSPTEIREGLGIGTVIGRFTTVDPDASNNQTNGYSLVSGVADNAAFTIKGDSLRSAIVFDHDVKSSYTIKVEVNDGKGGTFQKDLTITIIADPDKFSATDYISPNGDGINDTWTIKNIYVYQGFSVWIYNDAGTKIFTTNNYQNDWEGTYNGKKLPEGLYYYLIQSPDKSKKFKGTITLNR